MNNPSPAIPPRARRGTAEQTRQKIIDALVELLEDHAVWEIPISMLTRRVGVSSQLFYRHFSNLDDVLCAHWRCVLAELPDIEPLISGDWGDEEGFDRLYRVSEINLAFWNKHRTVLRVLGMLGDLRQPQFLEFRAMRGRAMAKALSKLASRQQARGTLPSALNPAQVGWEMTSRLQMFGLSFPQVVEQGTAPDFAVRSYSAMLALSLGFRIPDQI